MDERIYLGLLIVLIAIGTLNLVLNSGVARQGQLNDLARNLNMNQSRESASTQNIIQIGITNINNSAGNLRTSILIGIANGIAQLNRTAIASSSSMGAAIVGVNQNISSIKAAIASSNQSVLQGLLANSINMQRANANTEYNAILGLSNNIRYINQSITSINANTEIGWLKTWTLNQTVAPNHWLFNQMLDSFSNHINVMASNQINITIFTVAGYSNFSTSNAYNKVAVYNSTGVSNSINFYFNNSRGCGAYLYVVRASNSMQTFVLYPNISAKYNPTSSLTGVCQ